MFRPLSSRTLAFHRTAFLIGTTRMNWTEEQVKLAFHIYCQLPFGKLHSRNPAIVELASLIGRTPSAVAMKCTNLASLDPAITGSGRKGLSGASALDQKVWNEFNADWDRLANECTVILNRLHRQHGIPEAKPEESIEEIDYTGRTKETVTQIRVGQSFFRKAVLSAYDNVCCMSGISESRLLVASHILPWNKGASNRLNPRNGLCLSALHDRAYDRGLITVTTDYTVRVSPVIHKHKANPLIANSLINLEGAKITLPSRFHPDPSFLKHHSSEIFLRKAA